MKTWFAISVIRPAISLSIVLFLLWPAQKTLAGWIVGWGNNDYGQASPPAGKDFVTISAGYWHGLALKSDGSIVGWGKNDYGQATPPGGNDFIAIAAGGAHSLALKSDGSIVGWGDNRYGQATPPPGNDFVAIATGGWHSLALKSDGSIVGWGSNYDWNGSWCGQVTPPPGNDFIAIAAGGWHSLALKSNGSIVGWGNTFCGQATPPSGNNFIAIDTGDHIYQYSLALKKDGSIVGWGLSGDGPGIAPDGNDFIAIAEGEGDSHSLALKSDGSIVAWGDNRYGQARPPTGKNFVAISAGSNYSLAIELRSLILREPNGGETLMSGATRTIIWRSVGSISNILIEYSTNNGADWMTSTTVPNTGSYKWLVPTVDSNQSLIRISDGSDPNVNDMSDAVFTITTYTTYTIVPDVVGMSLADARSALVSGGLFVGTVKYICSSTLPAENVITQDQVGDTSVVTGSSVDLIASKGAALYVDNDAPNDPIPNNPNVSDPDENGFQKHPFDGIQEAIDASVHGDTVIVLPGMYSRWGNHDIDFRGKKIVLCSTDPNDSNIVAATVIDCNVTPEESHCGFIFNSQEGTESVIEGLTIINAYGTAISCGNSSSPTIRNCILMRNQCDNGTISCDVSNPKILNCIIQNNLGSCCGVYLWRSSPVIYQCTITNNGNSRNNNVIACYYGSKPIIDSCTISYNKGNAIYCSFNNIADDGIGSDPNIINCNITNNFGNGIYVLKSNATITNCKISGNLFCGIRGQMYATPPCRPYSMDVKIKNCLITGSYTSGVAISSFMGGEIFLTIQDCTIVDTSKYWGGISSNGYVTVTNCIVWGNTPRQISGGIVSYSDVQAGYPGQGNIDADPMFTRRGYWDVNGTPDDLLDDFWIDGDYHLLHTSPCIDVGDNNSVPSDITDIDGDANTTEPIPYDLDGRARIFDGDCNGTDVVDMGAYEFAHAYIGDFDCDDTIDFLDFAVFAPAWLTEPNDPQWNPQCDIAIPPDGYVDIRDLDVLVQNWLERFEPPTPASNPNPLDGTTDVLPGVGLSWIADFYTTSHDVYFGTNFDDVNDANNSLPVGTSAYKGNQVGRTFDPGIMALDTTYYWRIDEVNPYGTTTGSIWSFTTGPLPGPASDPDPADGSVGIEANPVLSWQPGLCVTSHNVFFGNSDPPPFVIEQNNATFEPGPLSCDTTYYWRIDEVNPYGTTTGSIWSFTTTFLSGPASEPDPPDGAFGIQGAPILTWEPGLCATSHNVFFGATARMAFQTNQAETTFNPGTLSPGTTYYWRIDEIGEYDTRTGAVWTFTTQPAK